MFGLGDEVGRQKRWVSASIGYDQNLTRPGNGIDGDFSEYHPFGRSDINVSRADNLIHFGNGLCAIGHGPDSLGSSDLEYGIDPRDVRCGQDSRV